MNLLMESEEPGSSHKEAVDDLYVYICYYEQHPSRFQLMLVIKLRALLCLHV